MCPEKGCHIRHYFDFDSFFEHFDGVFPSELNTDKEFLLAIYIKNNYTEHDLGVNNNVICFLNPYHQILTVYRYQVAERINRYGFMNKKGGITTSLVLSYTGPNVFYDVCNFLLCLDDVSCKMTEKGIRTLLALDFWGHFTLSLTGGKPRDLSLYSPVGDGSWRDSKAEDKVLEPSFNLESLSSLLKRLILEHFDKLARSGIPQNDMRTTCKSSEAGEPKITAVDQAKTFISDHRYVLFSVAVAVAVAATGAIAAVTAPNITRTS